MAVKEKTRRSGSFGRADIPRARDAASIADEYEEAVFTVGIIIGLCFGIVFFVGILMG